MALFAELKRRNIFRVALLYVVSAWLVLQGAEFLFDVLGVPDWGIKALLGVAMLGLPAVLVFAWVFEVTPEGIKRESEVVRSEREIHRSTRRLDIAVIIVVLLGILALALDNAVRPPPEPTAESPGPEAIGEAARKPGDEKAAENSIAVLAFQNMSADEDNRYFAEGVSEEILNQLAKVEDLRVAARTSSFQFQGQNLDIGKIADALNVRHVLEGSVRRAGNRVRVTAQLIDAGNGFHVWSDNFDRELDDIFAIQDEIAGKIVGALVSTLAAEGLPSSASLLTDSPGAYELFLQGRHLWRTRRTEALERAVELFEQAVEIDPAFDRAWSNLAVAWNNRGTYDPSVSDEEARAQMRRAAERALAINPENGEALTTRALLLAEECRLVEADRLYQRARTVDPKDPTAHHWHTLFLLGVGHLRRADESSAAAYALDPENAAIVATRASAVHALGHAERSIELWQEARALGMSNATPYYLAMAQARLGRLEEAERLFRADRTDTAFSPEQLRLFLAAARGEGSVEAFEGTLGEDVDFEAMNLLILLGADKALDAISECDPMLMRGFWGPGNDIIADPRFLEAMEAAGYVDYWEERGWPDQCARLTPLPAGCRPD